MFDVVVVGGGPAGSATAIGFAAQGRSVLVLDAAHFPRTKACAEYVSPGGVAILRRLGALERIGAGGVGRYLRGMEIQAPDGGCHLVDYRDVHDQVHFGLSVPRIQLDAILLDIARERGVAVREGFRVTDVVREGARVRGVIGRSGEHIQADLVVGADGGRSVVARAVAVSRPARWPRRLGLVAHFEGVDWPEDHGRMVVGAHGYVGVAPLDGSGLLSVGLVRSMPRTRLGSGVTALLDGLADYPRVAARLRHGRLASGVIGVGPLARRVRASTGPGWALVGDAAGFFDPFTGEGIFRALRGAEVLTICPSTYARERARVFGPKERLVALIQVFIQTPRLMNVAIKRLRDRPQVARELGAVLGDLWPARLDLAWRLLGP